ncbi:MAG: hypothetical protein PHS60_10340 [Zavarzinia sp.]|nr:hypothetical protein [Zavarzinia sp.]
MASGFVAIFEGGHMHIPGLSGAANELHVQRAKITRNKIMLFIDSPARRPIEFEVVGTSREQRVVLGRYTWPEDLGPLSTKDDEPEWNLVVKFRDKDLPFRKIEIEPVSPSIKVEYAKGYGLEKLFVVNEKEFAAVFFRARTRVRNRESLMFACWQVLTYADLDTKSRVVASVIYVYKMMEFNQGSTLAQFLPQLAETIEEAKLLPRRGGVRIDGRMLVMSALTAKWHGELFLGKWDDLVATLDELVQFIEEMAPRPVAMIYNAARGLAMRAIIAFECGDAERTRRLCELNFALFKYTANHLQPKSEVFFGEMIRSGGAVQVCLQMLNKIDGEGFKIELKKVLPDIIRISPEDERTYKTMVGRTAALLKRCKGA